MTKSLPSFQSASTESTVRQSRASANTNVRAKSDMTLFLPLNFSLVTYYVGFGFLSCFVFRPAILTQCPNHRTVSIAIIYHWFLFRPFLYRRIKYSPVQSFSFPVCQYLVTRPTLSSASSSFSIAIKPLRHLTSLIADNSTLIPSSFPASPSLGQIDMSPF